jgi:transposase
MGAVLDLAPTHLPSPARQRLKDLAGTRRALVDAATAERNRLGTTADALCRRLALARIAQLKRHLARIDAEIEAVIGADPDLARPCDLLVTIPGVGRLTAAILLAEMPELGTMEARQAASLAGLAPIADDSGSRRGRRSIRGGRGALRQALYMPAVAAIRHNSAMQAFYERLRAAGKPAKLALTAVMRKLVITANAMLRDARPWGENPA